MNKKEFLNSLENGQVSAAQNRDELAKLPENAFKPFDDSLPIIEQQNFSPDSDYFYQQCSALKKSNFSKQRCEHLIDVKAKMQEMGVKGFVISEQNHQAQAAMRLKQEIEARLAEFKPQEDFQAAIEQRNIALVRAFISRDLMSEYLDAQDVADLVWYTQKFLPETFQTYEEDDKLCKPFISKDKSVWNYDYFINQQNSLNANFALERVLHLIHVRDELRQRGLPEFQKLGTAKTTQATSKESLQSQTQADYQNPENTQTSKVHSPQENLHTSSSFKKGLIIAGGILALAALVVVIFK